MNRVRLTGKVSRSGKVAYTAAGVPVMEFTLAVPQRWFDQENLGYYPVVLVGEAAETISVDIRIGRVITVKGSLWTRTYRNRQGAKVTETKVLAESIGGQNEKDG